MTTHRICYDSPLGPLLLTSDGASLTGLYLPGYKGGPEREQGDSGENALPFREAKRQLDAYFARRLTEFDLPLALHGTPFQVRVWEELRRIPYGHTLSYGALARRLGNPNASRAVGLANGRNPLSIIVPCHRVIGTDGRLIGYGGGLSCKQALLEREASAQAKQPLLF